MNPVTFWTVITAVLSAASGVLLYVWGFRDGAKEQREQIEFLTRLMKEEAKSAFKN